MPVLYNVMKGCGSVFLRVVKSFPDTLSSTILFWFICILLYMRFSYNRSVSKLFNPFQRSAGLFLGLYSVWISGGHLKVFCFKLDPGVDTLFLHVNFRVNMTFSNVFRLRFGNLFWWENLPLNYHWSFLFFWPSLSSIRSWNYFLERYWVLLLSFIFYIFVAYIF